MTDSVTKSGKNLPTLSEGTIDELKKLRESDLNRFYALVASLRAQKWPLRAIAEPLGVSRSIVTDWEGKAIRGGLTLPAAESIPPSLPKQIKAVYSTYKISEEDRAELAKLTPLASTVRRYTDAKAPSRVAAARLEELLRHHERQGASLAELARACGVTRRAIAQRLEK